MILIYNIIYFLYLYKCGYIFSRKVKNVVNLFIIKLRNIIRKSKKLNVIDRIDNDPKNSFLKLYLKFFFKSWDEKNFLIRSHPIP
jgi:hypothetical protein